MINASGRNCAGQIIVRTRAAGRRRAPHSGRLVARRLRVMNTDCTYRSRFTFPVKRLPARLRPRSHRVILTVRVKYAGNDVLLPDGSPRRKVRINRGA
jgi:hypothetical protein